MGMSYTLRLFKGTAPEIFRAAMEETARATGAILEWGVGGVDQIRLSHAGDVHSLYVPYLDGVDSLFCVALGARLAVPWMELRIQEGALWDYVLSEGEKVADLFSTFPQYWDDMENPDAAAIKEWKGDPAVLARLWNLPVERIEHYLVNWGWRRDATRPEVYQHLLTGKAYPSDHAPYGNYEQFFDFLRTLGGVEPTETHSLRLPPRSAWRSGGYLRKAKRR